MPVEWYGPNPVRCPSLILAPDRHRPEGKLDRHNRGGHEKEIQRHRAKSEDYKRQLETKIREYERTKDQQGKELAKAVARAQDLGRALKTAREMWAASEARANRLADERDDALYRYQRLVYGRGCR